MNENSHSQPLFFFFALSLVTMINCTNRSMYPSTGFELALPTWKRLLCQLYPNHCPNGHHLAVLLHWEWITLTTRLLPSATGRLCRYLITKESEVLLFNFLFRCVVPPKGDWGVLRCIYIAFLLSKALHDTSESEPDIWMGCIVLPVTRIESILTSILSFWYTSTCLNVF